MDILSFQEMLLTSPYYLYPAHKNNRLFLIEKNYFFDVDVIVNILLLDTIHLILYMLSMYLLVFVGLMPAL